MKVVLRKDVEKLGEAGDVKDVSGGYARNFLVPKGLAVYASEGELKMAAHNQAVKDRKITRQEEQLKSLGDKIQGTTLEFEARAGEGGRLFGSITAEMIATKLAQQISEEIDRRKVETDAIREVGSHEVAIHLVGKLRPTITVKVKAEQVEEEESPAEESAADETESTDETATEE